MSADFNQLLEATSALQPFAEGDLVRSTNDLYKSYGVGYIQKVRGEQAKVEFNPSVFMQPPYRYHDPLLLPRMIVME